jgi:geranylgeranyl reductase family protein
MQHFDALVVGAGPAGSSTALRLADGGAKVLLVDRARFPRDKPCGGGLTGRALRHAPCPVDPVVEHVVDGFRIRLRYGRSFTRRHATPLLLAEQAAAAGADFRDGLRVTDLLEEGTRVTARIDGEPVTADVLVGADGANGIVARETGLGEGIVRGVALEANVAYGEIARAGLEGTAVIELGVVPGGYGWVFPKGDHANVGVGGWGSQGPHLRDHLARLIEAHGVDADALRDLRGHRLPMRPLGTAPSRGRVLLVGDAAGLVDPLSGDGIYEAFVSAQFAAQAILEGDLDAYAGRLAATLDHHASASWAAKRALDRSAAACFWAARSPGVFGVVAGLLAGDVRHPSEARGLARPPLRALARLAARGPAPGTPA